ncbi:MAG: hypothetical protein JWN48_1401 [Myxococcaceae bacterium]|nr:hypothetical protein [Myxococcaceae bacterium]
MHRLFARAPEGAHGRAGLGAVALLSLSVLTVLPSSGCGGDDSQTATGPCSAADALTYVSFGKPFFDTYCETCHAGSVVGAARQGAPPSYVFDSAALIKQHAADIRMDAVETRNMPFGSTSLKPSDADRAKLGQWLDCGAP